MTQIEPYLFFDGRTEEALEFYKTRLGANVDFLMRYKIMASDGNCTGSPSHFTALPDGGQVQMALNETFFARFIAGPKNP